jgi:hypothetical protein
MSESHEALERFETAHEHGNVSGLAKFAALTVAVVAAFLAVSTFLGNESVKEAIQGQTKVADATAQSQTFETQDEIFSSDELILTVLSGSSDQTVATASNAGLKALKPDEKQVAPQQRKLRERVTEAKKEVKDQNSKHLLYEISEVLLQIAIVLASVSIIANKRFLLLGGQVIAVGGAAMLLVGYLR